MWRFCVRRWLGQARGAVGKESGSTVQGGSLGGEAFGPLALPAAFGIVGMLQQQLCFLAEHLDGSAVIWMGRPGVMVKDGESHGMLRKFGRARKPWRPAAGMEIQLLSGRPLRSVWIAPCAESGWPFGTSSCG